MNYYDLNEAVIVLHDIARSIDHEYGSGGALSEGIRDSADKLNDILTLSIDSEADRVVFNRTPTNTPENVLKVLKS